MFFTINDPGPWQFYVKRADNIGLPIMEVKQKYLQEQALFENEQRRQYYEYMRMIEHSRGGAGGSGGGSIVFSGQGIDGPIAGATVTALAEGVTTTTDANGSFGFTFIPTGGLELTGGTDTVTGVPFTGTLKAPSGSTIISPITTAIKEVMDRHGHSETDATTFVFNYANKIYGINVAAEARERAKTENFITLGETDADMLKIAGLATVFESSAEVAGKAYAEQITGLTDATMTLKEGKESFYKSLAGMVHNRRTSTEPSDSVSNELAKGLRESTIRMVGFSGRPANLIQYSHINHAMDQTLDRVKEVVNDTTLDKDYAMASVMAQNRIAKQDFTSFVGTNGTVGLLFNSSSILVNNKESEAMENLGSIFEGKENRRSPAASRFPETINYISGSASYPSSLLNFGTLTRVGEFNGTAQYNGVIAGETTLVWYDTTNRSWVIDNNLTLPSIAVATTGQAYPLNRQKFRTTDDREIQLIEASQLGLADDAGNEIATAPTGSGRYINSVYQPRGANGAIDLTSVSGPTTDEETGVKTWTVAGDIHVASLDLGTTVTRPREGGITITGNFKITRNAESILYVIQKHPTEASTININGAGAVALTQFNLGFKARLGDEGIATGGVLLRSETNLAGMFET